ncbi:MAG: endonuclease/exonuclease/phosphatase family protein [Blastocatellia bacterium]
MEREPIELLLIAKLSLIPVLLCSLAGYAGRLHQYAELASHFRVQYLLVSTACLVFLLFHREFGWASGAALGCALNFPSILFWFFGGKASKGETGNGRQLRLLLANVNRANTRHDLFLAFVREHNPDVVIVQEVDATWSQALSVVHDYYPFNEIQPRNGGSGMALYSRLPFEGSSVSLSEGDARPGILVRIDLDGDFVWVFSIHPRAPIRPGHLDRRNRMLTAAAEHLESLPSPKICIGDLNTSLWSPYYRDFAKQTRLKNVRKGFGLLPTWPTFLRFRWLMIPIDHCLVSDDIRVLDAKAGDHIHSDHLPLLVTLEIPYGLRESNLCKPGHDRL